MRAEEMEIVRAKLHQRALAGNPPTLWDAHAPWSAVFFFAATDETYWRQHVIDPANLWIARGRPGASTKALPDAAAAEGHLPGGADLYHGAPDLGQAPKGRQKRGRSSSSSRRQGKKRSQVKTSPKSSRVTVMTKSRRERR